MCTPVEWSGQVKKKLDQHALDGTGSKRKQVVDEKAMLRVSRDMSEVIIRIARYGRTAVDTYHLLRVELCTQIDKQAVK